MRQMTSKPGRRMTSFHLLLLMITGIVVLLGCNRDFDFDLDGAKPADPTGHMVLAWTIERPPSDSVLPCAAAGAQHVFVYLEPSNRAAPPTTYRLPCALSSEEAWVPVKSGDWDLKVELESRFGQTLSVSPSKRLRVVAGSDFPRVPVLFHVK